MAARSALPEPKQDDSRAPALLGIDKSLVVRASPRPIRTERWDRLTVWWVMDSEALAGIALMREDVSTTWPGPGGLMTAFMRHVPIGMNISPSRIRNRVGYVEAIAGSNGALF